MRSTAFVLALMLLLTGCAGQGTTPASQESPPALTIPAAEIPQRTDPPTETVDSAASLADAVGKGYVIDFSDDGCTLSEILSEGNVQSSAAPGYEDTMTKLEVRYRTGCEFAFVYASISTGNYRYEAASRQDVKKQSNLYVLGEKDTDGVIFASRVYLFRLEE